MESTETMTNCEHIETYNSDNNSSPHDTLSPVYRNPDFAIDNSNDNHGVARTSMKEIHDQDKYGIDNKTIKFNEIGYNHLPNDGGQSVQEFDRDLDTLEILLSIDVNSGELNVDVVSQEMLQDFDNTAHAVLASTFDESVTLEYQKLFTEYKGFIDKDTDEPNQTCPLVYDNLHGNREPTQSCSLENDNQYNSGEPTKQCPFENDDQYNSGEPNQPGPFDNDNIHYSGEHEVQVSYHESSQSKCEDKCSKITPHLTGSPGGGDYHVYNVGVYVDKEWSIQDKVETNCGLTANKHVDVDTARGKERAVDANYDPRRHDRYYKKHRSVEKHEWDHVRNTERRYNKGHHRQDNYKPHMEETRGAIKPKHVISFSESDLIYSSKSQKQTKNYKTSRPQINKQITILKRGSTLKTDTDILQNKHLNGDEQLFADDDTVPDGNLHRHISVDGESIPYGKHSVNISSDRKYYSKTYGEMKEDADGSGDTEEEQNGKKRKITKNIKKAKQKVKKPKKKIPKTRMEIFQAQLKGGQLKSVFSRWKSDGLKRIKLVEELHNGTFAVKYKAIYNNEMVVLSVYIDQDTSDINAVDMVHLRNSKFINGIRDCFTGPYSSIWLLSRYFHYSDLQKLLFKDPDRHVIGEVHAQFVTAGLILGLDYLHKNGIVHGNVKPSKVLISRDGFPVLTGYLIVDESVLEERRDVYTPAYAAPERFWGHRGKSIDIFSVGCLGYEIVTGRTPFDDGNMEELRSNILGHSYRPLFEPELFSYAGEMFIDSCLRKTMKNRFTVGHDRENFMCEEWFSTLDLYQMERQNVYSPLLQAMKQIENSTTLPWRQKTVEFDWGRALDITRPDLEPIQKFDIKFTRDMLYREFY